MRLPSLRQNPARIRAPGCPKACPHDECLAGLLVQRHAPRLAGFTLDDLISCDRKRNEANGGANRDGSDDNSRWSCGIEGPSDDPEVEALRNRQIKNLLALNPIALRSPMILMGDEARRTQPGNKNAYCQGNELGWLDWTLQERRRDLQRFVRELIALRQRRKLSAAEHGLTLNRILLQASLQWHGALGAAGPGRRLSQPAPSGDWADDRRSI